MTVQTLEFTGTEVSRRCHECGTTTVYPQGQRPAVQKLHKPNCPQLPPPPQLTR